MHIWLLRRKPLYLHFPKSIQLRFHFPDPETISGNHIAILLSFQMNQDIMGQSSMDKWYQNDIRNYNFLSNMNQSLHTYTSQISPRQK